MQKARSLVRNRRGATLAFVAVCLAALLGMGALAVDMGMLLKTRSDMQRAADAAALAGASGYINLKADDPAATELAYTRAIDYTGQNYIGTTPIDTSGQSMFSENGNTYLNFKEGQIQVLPGEEKVRVVLTRAAVGTWFGRVLGKSSVDIAASAAAVAMRTGQAKCIKPFAFPDMWHDLDDDTDPANRLQDLGPGQGKGGEQWQYDAGDVYQRYSDPNGDSGTWTGLGSSWRNGSVAKEDQKDGTKYYDDYGRPIVLKKSNPQQTMNPGWFQPWVIPGTNPGAKGYKESIVGCSTASINLNEEYTTDPTADTSSYDNKPGNMIGPTKQAMDELIAQDPDACWASFPHTDPAKYGYTSGEVRKFASDGKTCSEPYPGWESSPRVIKVPLMDPSVADNGRTKLKFNNIALLFIEEQKGRHDPVVARFLYFAKGTGAGPEQGSLMKSLKLVE